VTSPRVTKYELGLAYIGPVTLSMYAAIAVVVNVVLAFARGLITP
jgi:hypothetical protein